ncbi:hypothetical protein [Nocardia thailandica]|uniref:hypothetical protein n=1 Tax=Nocardia thailandica TaxID=257275 RepID=UPI0003002F41|nr:hypothetical protein [Nocardia thailandica]
MAITSTATNATPSWVSSAAWNRLTGSGIAQPSTGDALGGGKVHDYKVKDGAAAVQLLSRIRNADSLTLDSPAAPVQASPIGLPGLSFVNDRPSIYPADDPRVGTDPVPPTVSTPSGQQQPAQEQAQPAPAAGGNPLYEPPIPIPGAKPDPGVSTPATSLLDMPNVAGHGVGDSWDGTMLDGRPVRYTIPEGNGTNSVDLEITNSDGTIDRWRIASDGAGGLQHWHDDANGQSSYAGRVTAESTWEIQSFDPGAPTYGVPSHTLEADPGFKSVYSPSFVDGVRVGTDIGKLNAFGFYDNYHIDNYGNLTISHARPDGRGGVESKFYQQYDRNSWRLGEDGEFWEVGPDLQGRITKGRTVETPTGTHIYFIDHNNVLFDSFRGTRTSLGLLPAYTDRYVDDKIFRKYGDGTSVTFDRNFEVISFVGPPDRRSGIEKLIDGAKGIPGNIAHGVTSWFTRTIGLDAMAEAVANAGNPYYIPPTPLERIATFSEGIATPVRFAGDLVLDPYMTVVEWAGRHILYGGLYASSYLASGDTRRNLTGAADEMLAESPSTTDAAINAGFILLPMTGSIFRGIGSGVSALSRVVGSARTIRVESSLYLSQSKVKAALDSARSIEKIDGRPIAIGDGVRRLLPRNEKMLRILQQHEFLEDSLLGNPKTLLSLLQHPKAIDIIDDVLKGVKVKPRSSVDGGLDISKSAPLTKAQREISARVTENFGNKPVQSGFDLTRKLDDAYRREFISDLIRRWEIDQPAVNKMSELIAKKFKGKSYGRENPKDITRADAKVRDPDDYNYNASLLVDVVGSKVVFKTVDDIYKALAWLERDAPFEVLRIKDRIASPMKSGYRDILMNVRAPSGQVAELRLHLAGIEKRSEEFDHAVFEVTRDLKTFASDAGRELIPAEAKFLRDTLERTNVIFWDALQEGLPKGL